MERNWKDVAYGGAVAGFGGFIAYHSVANYRLGTVSAMGPGMFPMGLGVLLLGFGLAIAAIGLLSGPKPGSIRLDPRATIAVLSGIGLFAATIATLGLFPAIILTVLAATMADTKLKLPGALALAAALCLLIYVVFVLGLGVSWPLIRWGF